MALVRINNSGGVSLLSVLVFSLIVTVVAMAYISGVITQQKNAFNYDQSTRAYYAAESGVQDAVRGLRDSPSVLANNKNECTPYIGGTGTVGANSSYGLAYTCQLVSASNSLTGNVELNGAKNATAKLELKNPEPGPYKLVVRWSPTTNEGQEVVYPIQRTGNESKLLAKYYGWNRGGDPAMPVHAMLRINVFAHPTANFSRDSIKQRVMYLNPTTNKDTDPTINYNDDALNASGYSQQSQLITNAACFNSNAVSDSSFGNYSCKAVINLGNPSTGNSYGYDLTNKSIYVRVGSLYRSTGFSLELTNASGTLLDLKNGQADIDVTGRSGSNIFKRIKQSVSVGGFYEDSQPDAALVSAEGICKLFTLTNSSASYSQGCDPMGTL